MEGIRFESKSQREAQRNLKREAQQGILSRAKADFHRQKAREEKKKEQTWMLPSVSSRIDQREEEQGLRKKHKKPKKQKKGKKHKRKDSGSSSDESGIDEWVEKDAGTKTSSPAVATSHTNQNKLERDSWMTLPANFASTLSREEFKQKEKGCKNAKQEEELKKLALEKPGQHVRELNPYWKDGGSGLPEEESATSEISTKVVDVGDSGLRWLRQAYRRAEEQAAEEDRTLEEVAAERWGSLEKLQSMLKDAEIKNGEKYKSSRSHPSNHERWGQRERNADCHGNSLSSGGLKMIKPASSRGMFMPPKNDDDDEPMVQRNDKPGSNYKPRWKKKEFVEEKPPEAGPAGKSSNEIPIKKLKTQSSSSECSSDDAEELPAKLSPSPTLRLTDKEMNELGAKILKAELMGNAELASALKKKLESARKVNSEPGSNTKAQEVVIMTRTDSKGMTRPLAQPEFPSEPSKGRKKQKVETHDHSGKRDRYFADDDKYSLKQMFEREKLGTAEDQNEMFARLAGKGLDRTNEDYDMDDVFVTKANKANQAKLDARERLYAINEHKRSSAALERCPYCFDGKNMSKHLITAIGMKVYMCLPSFQSLTEGHCLIVPMQHVSAATYLDEDVWSEVQIFRKGLTKMFEEQGRDTVFFETSMHLKSYPHMALQCVPLPKDVGNLAPMYFKKAILESETEWALNKKLVDLSKKGIHKAVPRGLPYFSVDFGLEGGFAHVIEDEKLFPKNFAQSIIGGMLDLDPNMWRRPIHENFNEQCKKVLRFAEWWKPFDWTQRLKQQHK